MHTLPGPKIEEIKISQGADDYFGTGGATEKVLSVSSISYNCKGFLVAVGYSYLSHTGWCSHRSFVRTWSLSTLKQTELEIEGCASSVSFSPIEPSLLAIGSYNGVLILWDLDKEQMINRSSIDEYQHREAISSILWVKSLQHPLFTISTDGKVLNWAQESFEFPIRGMLIKGRHELEGGTSFSVTEDQSALIVGSESGKVLRFNIPILITHSLPTDGLKLKPEAELILNNMNSTYRQQILKAANKYCKESNLKEIDVRAIFANKPDITKCYPSNASFYYETHDGPVTGIACNPFHRNLFASCSNDGTIKLFNALHGKTKYALEPVLACKALKVAWSEIRPLVLAVGSENGSVYLYDFMQSKTQFIMEISCQRNSVVDVIFNKGVRNYITVGYKSGEVKIYQLPDMFGSAHPDEGRRLGLILEDIII